MRLQYYNCVAIKKTVKYWILSIGNLFSLCDFQYYNNIVSVCDVKYSIPFILLFCIWIGENELKIRHADCSANFK